MTTQYTKRFQKLNKAQKQAVKTTEGPVLVIAGPGTGKTELLSMRAAQILKTTDTLPESILCITFTDAASANMQSRLSNIIGATAQKVNIHTFHSFALAIRQRYPDYFALAIEQKPLTEVHQIEIISELFNNLAPDDKLRVQHPESGFIYLRDCIRIISTLKREGITPERFSEIAQSGKTQAAELDVLLDQYWQEIPRLGKKHLDLLQKLQQDLAQISHNKADLTAYYSRTLAKALLEAETSGSTKPVSAWKRQHLKKTDQNTFVSKDTKRYLLLESVAGIYAAYQEKLYNQSFIDFDDMLLDFLTALQTQPELKFTLQEQYLYLMVDEFQDTNGVQSAILKELADSPINEGRPNILAVGDDDQAIYKFQGASVANMQEFVNQYRDPVITTLTENYRSTTDILEASMTLANGISDRFINFFPGIEKNLNANYRPETQSLLRISLPDPQTQYHAIAQKLKQECNQGHAPSSYAIIGRNHRELSDCAYHLQLAGLPINYEHQHNILEQTLIQELLTLCQFCYLLNLKPKTAATILPEILHFPAWELSPEQTWRIALAAQKNRNHWLEVLLDSNNPQLARLGKFLVNIAQSIHSDPVLLTLDKLVGSQPNLIDNRETYSPIKEFYFSKSKQAEYSYQQLLADLHTLYDAVRTHYSQTQATAKDLLNFIATLRDHNIPLQGEYLTDHNLNGVNLLTAHKAKGLEFPTVFLLNCTVRTWLKKRNYNKLSLPSNLPYEPDADNLDDALRLLYVAMTRAKSELYLCEPETNNTGKESVQIVQLADIAETKAQIKPYRPTLQLAPSIPASEVDLAALLAPKMQHYKLSATHLNNFLDLVYAGPQYFLEQNLLQFPQTMTGPSSYGNAIHNALEWAHQALLRESQLPDKQQILTKFVNLLESSELEQKELERYLAHGQQKLANFLEYWQPIVTTTDQPEVNFRSQAVLVQDVPLTGKIDRLVIDEDNKTITVIDYKTGSPLPSWDPQSPSKKLKAWKYRNQLLFYKLLVENSRDYYHYEVNKGVLEFVDADNDQERSLAVTYSEGELADFKELLYSVYQLIKSVRLPNTSEFAESITGVKEFAEAIKKGTYL